MNASTFLAACLIGVAAAAGAIAQEPPVAPCAPIAEERAVFKAVLTHFRVYGGEVAARAYGKALAPDTFGADTASAVMNFNARNATACSVQDGPISDRPTVADGHRTRLSRVGFAADAATAFVEVTMVGDPEMGSSHYVVLRKSERGWTVVKEEMYRMF